MAKTLLAVATATGVAATAAPATFLASSAGEGTGNIGHVGESKQPSEEISLQQTKTTEKVVTTVGAPTLKVEKAVETPPKQKFNAPSWKYDLIPTLTSAGNIKDKYEEIGCLYEYYGKINWNNGHTSSDFPKDLKEFTKGPQSKSCLIIEYYKQNYKDKKWWGEFRLIWSLKDETNKQGFITVINASTSGGKLSGTTAAYVLKKEDKSGNSWIVSHAKEGKKQSIGGGGVVSNLIPRNNISMEGFANSDYWGFEPSLWSVCGEYDCAVLDKEGSKKSYSWELIGSSWGNPVHFWSFETESWLTSNFGWNKLTDNMYSFIGTWNKKQFAGKPK